MTDATVEEYINEYCNPVSIADINKIIKTFNHVEYEDYTNEFYGLIDRLNKDGNDNISIMINVLLMKHCDILFDKIGITINKDESGLHEYAEVLSGSLTVNDISVELAEEFLNIIYADDDSIDAMSHILEKLTTLSFSLLYTIIDNVDNSYIYRIETVLTEIIDGDEIIDTDINISLLVIVNIIKNIEPGTDILGLRLTNDSDIIYSTISSLLENNFPNDFTMDNVNQRALDIMSLLIIGKDSRKDRLNYYVEYVDDLIDNELIKAKIYSRLKIIDNVVNDLIKKYDKYNVFSKMEVKNGEYR